MNAPTAHDTISDLLAVYALDAVDHSERAVIDRHLTRCDACRREVDTHCEVAAQLTTDEVPTPAHLWDSIRSEATTAENTVVSLDPHRFRRRRVRVMGIAAVTALVVGVAVQTGRVTSLEADLAAARTTIAGIEASTKAPELRQVALAAAASPNATSVSLTAGSAVLGTVIILPDGTGWLLADSLAPLTDGRTYQMWAIEDGEVISAGILGSNPDVIPFSIDPAVLEGIVITAEEAGGVAVSEAPPVAAWLAEA